MFNIIQIAKHNRKTFYDFSNGEELPVWQSYVIKIIISSILAIVFCNISKDFLNAILTIYAILIGFSFNIVFYLLSINKTNPDLIKDSLERQNKIEKINKLTDELFYNVSYFNIISILVTITALLFFLADSQNSELWTYFEDIEIIKELIVKWHSSLHYTKIFAILIYKALFYFVIIESMGSFLRTIGRVNFYFQEKLKLQNSAVL